MPEGLNFGLAQIVFINLHADGRWAIALAILVSLRAPVLGYWRFVFLIPAFVSIIALGLSHLPPNAFNLNLFVVFLVFILGLFVYKPILSALDRRREKIEQGIEFSEKAKSELESIEELKAKSIKQAEMKSVEIVKAAAVSAQGVREGLIKEAEEEKEKVIASGQVVLAEERKRLEKGVYSSAVTLVQSALGRVLSKKHFSSEEEALIEETINQIKRSISSRKEKS